MTDQTAAADAAVSVQVAVPLDNLDKDLQSALDRLQKFDKAAGTAGKGVNDLNRNVDKHREASRAAHQQSNLLLRQFAVLKEQVSDYSSELGRATPYLSAFGAKGLAVAAGIGVAAVAIEKFVETGTRMAEVGGSLKNLADSTGFTVLQLQALQQAGGRVQVTQEQVRTGMERFIFALADAKEGSGQLYDAMREVDAGLADQLARSKTSAEAWDIVSGAIEKAATAEEKMKLARAATGRGLGAGGIRLAAETITGGGTEGLVNTLKEIDRILPEQAANWNALGDAIAENTLKAKNNFGAIFAEPALKNMHAFSEAMLEVSRYAKEHLGGLSEYLDNLGQSWDNFKVKIWSNITGTSSTPPAKNVPGESLYGQAADAPKPVTSGTTETYVQAGQAADAYVEKVNKVKDATVDLSKEAVLAAADSKRLMDVLGGAATPAEQLKDKILQLNATAAKFPDMANAVATAQGRLRSEFANTQVQNAVAALGDAATYAERYRARISELREQLSKGQIDQNTFNRAVSELKSSMALEEMRENISALGDAATSTEKYKLQVEELKKKLEEGKISQETFNRAVRGLDPVVQALNDTIASLGAGLVSAFLNGENAANALKSSLQSVAATASSKALQDFLKGGSLKDNAAGLGLAGGAALGSLALGAKSGASGALYGAAGGALAGASLGGPLGAVAGGLIGAIGGLLSGNANKKAEQQQQQAAMQQALLAQQQAAAQLAQQQADAAASYGYQTQIAGLDTSRRVDAFKALELEIQQGRLEASKVGGAAITAYETLANAKRLQLTKEWEEKIADLKRSYLDREFAAINDTSTLVGKLAAYDRQAATEREKAVKAGGEALVELDRAQLAERKKIFSEAASSISDYYDGLKTQITDFTRSLKYGDLSTLSPAEQYLTARNDYQTQLQAALGGDRGAQGNITGYAQTLIEQARSYLGPSVEFGQLVERITQQLGDLPSIAYANDPQVQELQRLGEDYFSPMVDTLSTMREQSADLQEQVISILSSQSTQNDMITAAIQKLGLELRQGLASINIKAA